MDQDSEVETVTDQQRSMTAADGDSRDGKKSHVHGRRHRSWMNNDEQHDLKVKSKLEHD